MSEQTELDRAIALLRERDSYIADEAADGLEAVRDRLVALERKPVPTLEIWHDPAPPAATEAELAELRQRDVILNNELAFERKRIAALQASNRALVAACEAALAWMYEGKGDSKAIMVQLRAALAGRK